MASPNAKRAAHRGDGGDPQKAVLLGGKQHSDSTLSNPPQAANGLHVELIYTRDLAAAVTRSRANTSLAAAFRGTQSGGGGDDGHSQI